MSIFTILIVDDTPAEITLLRTILQKEAYKTLVAENGERALTQLDYVLPDLILLDVDMPGLNGFETCAQLRTMPSAKHIPVIFLTGLTDTKSKVRGFESGGNDYITKPVEAAEVLARVNTHLTLSALYRQLQKQNALLEEQIRLRTAVLEDTDTALQAEIKQRKRQEDEKDKLFGLVRQQGEQLRDLTSWLINAQQRQRRNLADILPSYAAELDHAQNNKPLESLTVREREVLSLLADGRSSVEIANILNLADVTVRTYRTRIMKKLDIHHLAGLVKFALKYNLTDPL